MAIVEVKNKNEITQACLLHAGIVECAGNIAFHVVKLGEFLKTMKDKALYRYLDCETWEEYIALPEIPLKRSSIYDYMRLYGLYREKLGINEEALKMVGQYKLRIIAPVVEQSPEEWLNKAHVLTRADLINEVREAQNKPPMKERRMSDTSDLGKNYLEYLASHPCILHPDRQSERAHFPRTTKRGGKEDEVIPLCRECHAAYHSLGVVSFFSAYRNEIMTFFYETIRKLYEKLGQ